MGAVHDRFAVATASRRAVALPGLRLIVEGDDPGLLDREFANTLTAFEAPADAAGRLTLRVTDHGVVCDEDATLPAAIGLGDRRIELAEVVFRLYVHFCADRLLLHAAAVTRRGRAVLLAAPSTSGKTTLTLALLAHGWGYLSDELAAVDAATLDVAPYPRPLHVRPRTVRLLAATPDVMERLGRRLRFVEASPILTLGVPLSPPPMTLRVPVAAIVFPKYTPGGAQELIPLPPAFAATRLLAQTMNPQTVQGRAIPWALAISRQIPCFTLAVDVLDQAAAVLRELLP